MRSIINDLRQREFQNANLADNWAYDEIREAAALNNNIGNVPEMAGRAKELAGVLRQFNNTANHAALQLGNVEKMLDDLENQFR